jgi:hypothetical protein
MKATIADALHLAADKYLASDYKDYKSFKGVNRYSCCAVADATDELNLNYGTAITFLNSLGCHTRAVHLFNKQEHWSTKAGMYFVTPKSQGYRYLWLKFAAAMAESEGI